MVEEYKNNITAGSKRKLSEDSNTSKKTLKQQLAEVIQIQNNLLDLLKTKLDVSDQEIEKCKVVDLVSFTPIKRNSRIIPGIYKDQEGRKYYINSFGTFVYKRPCGKPRKDHMWCYHTGSWVEPGQEISENRATSINLSEDPNNAEVPENSADADDETEDLGAPDPEYADEETGEVDESQLPKEVLSDSESDSEDEDEDEEE